MFIFIVYGVGPRHCQNVGCSKSTAKAQLWDTPSVKLTDAKVGKPVHLPSLLSSCHLPLPGSGLLLALPLAQRSPTAAPCPWKGSHLTHISLPGQLSSAPSVPGELSTQDLLGTSCSSKKMGQNTILTKPPPTLPWAQGFPSSSNFHYAPAQAGCRQYEEA